MSKKLEYFFFFFCLIRMCARIFTYDIHIYRNVWRIRSISSLQTLNNRTQQHYLIHLFTTKFCSFWILSIFIGGKNSLSLFYWPNGYKLFFVVCHNRKHYNLPCLNNLDLKKMEEKFSWISSSSYSISKWNTRFM